MQTTVTERRKTPRRQRFLSQEPIRIRIAENGFVREFYAQVKDISDGGLGVECTLPFDIGSSVAVTGVLVLGLSHKKLEAASARVISCKPSDTGYLVGLEFVPAGSRPEQQLPSGAPDYYDLLQLSPKADPDTIHRVYRILAQRYHPDNLETGDQVRFRELLEAYRILSDPEKRAAYDATLIQTRQLRWKIFDQSAAAKGKEAELRKRAGVLSLLYAQRLNQPQQPTMTVLELEDLLGCPREHLEFTFWYLKDTGCITRTDNGRYSITVKGVDTAEADKLVQLPDDHLLDVPRVERH